MFKKIAIACLAMFVLSGCSSSYRKNPAHLAEFNKEIGDRVFFTLNHDNLTSESMKTLAHQAKWLKKHKAFCITIEGHCDVRGTKAYNIALGERRAETVKRYLVDQGIDIARISVISYGKERPVAIGHSKESHAQNRRAVTVIK